MRVCVPRRDAQEARVQELEEITRMRREEAERRAKETEEQMRARAKQRAYYDSLKRQADDHKRLRNGLAVSDKEKLINRHLLDRAGQDERFVDYVKGKLLPQLEVVEGAKSRRSSIK
jgi:hypothetical protein